MDPCKGIYADECRENDENNDGSMTYQIQNKTPSYSTNPLIHKRDVIINEGRKNEKAITQTQ